jgi:glucoamylase
MRDLPVGNGSLLINFDDKYQIRDIYFPHVGQENHTEGYPFRLGVWADGDFSWVFSDEWERNLRYLDDSSITDVTLTNRRLGLVICSNDMVAEGENVFIRRLRVLNLHAQPREIRVFLHHDFRIYENKIGDTAYYDPAARALIHYKRHRYFLINTMPHFNEFATGRKDFGHQEGTWRDAEDGHLHGAAITEGSVDSTIGVHCRLPGSGELEFYYWIAVGTNHAEVEHANKQVLEKGPHEYFNGSNEPSAPWQDKVGADLTSLPAAIQKLYRRSLMIIRTQCDRGGAIVAANDHDVTQRATDHYSYLWTRDGAFIANALDIAGCHDVPRKFFTLCGRIVHERGYFLQKYNPDGSIGSGWHSHWDKQRQHELIPIQEDETALVLWALWEHYEHEQDLEFIRDLYPSLIVKCADFLVEFRDPHTHLPLPSWNLWENRHGIHTFTCATVVAGLRAAANFARLFEQNDRADAYAGVGNEITDAMRNHLFSEKLGRFLRSVNIENGSLTHPDITVDASLFATFYFGCFAVDDPTVAGTMKAIEEKLAIRTEVGGIARFENDDYMLVSNEVTGNPWFICTLWLAEYYIAAAKSSADLEKALALLKWTSAHAMPSGVLAEQLDPLTGVPVSVSPLTWSHSTFVACVHSYLNRIKELS